MRKECKVRIIEGRIYEYLPSSLNPLKFTWNLPTWLPEVFTWKDIIYLIITEIPTVGYLKFTYLLTWSTRLPEVPEDKYLKYLLTWSTCLPEVPEKMCYVRGMIIQTHRKDTKQQVRDYNQQQWEFFRMLMKEVFKEKNYGEQFEYLLSELREGHYWHLVKFRLTMIQDDDQSNSVSGSRYQPPEDSSSSSEGEWENANDVLAGN